MTELVQPGRGQRFSWPVALGTAAATFVVAVFVPPLAALAGVVALVALVVSISRPLPRRATAVAAGVVAAVVCYLAIWAVGSVIDPSDPTSGTERAPNAAQPRT